MSVMLVLIVALITNGNAQTFSLDTVQRKADSLRRAELKKKAPVETKVTYSANDSIVFNLVDKNAFLYGKISISYKDINLQAERARVNWAKAEMEAGAATDSAGNTTGYPVFKEKDDVYNTETIHYNFKTRKGRITYAYTNQKEDYIHGDTIRRNPDNSFYIKDGRFTTCSDPNHPHFYFKAAKLKVIPGDRVITGPVRLVIADLPTPLFLPFGFFPFKKTRASGILMPAYGNARDRGFFFRDLGFYWAASQYFDARFTADIFTRGGYRIGVLTNYKLMYSFDGALNVEYAKQTYNEPGDPNYAQNTNFGVTWQHNQTFTPSARLTADVQITSPNFLRQTSFNIMQNLMNARRSSVSFNKRLDRIGLSLTANASVMQELSRRTNTITFPDIAINKDRMFPFKRRVMTGKEQWYEKVGLTYQAILQATVNNIHDSILFTPKMRELVQSGIIHQLNTNFNAKAFKYVTVTPSVNYSELWVPYSYENGTVLTRDKPFRTKVPGTDRDTIILRAVDSTFSNQKPGWSTARWFNTAVSASTILYGTRYFKGKSRAAIRHTLQPSFALNYRPNFGTNFWGYYDNIYLESQNQTIQNARIRSHLASVPLGEEFALGLNLANTVDYKYLPAKAADSSATKPNFTYIKLLDNFNFNTRYNFIADSLKLAPINTSLWTNFLDNLINLNITATLDPYGYFMPTESIGNVSQPRRIDVAASKLNQGILRLTNANTAIGINLKQATKSKQPNPPKPGTPEALYEPFDVPWSLNVNYSMSYSKPFMVGAVIHSLGFSGNLQLSPKWNINFRSNYDIERLRFGLTNVTITRDLHCWQMVFDVVPFGPMTRYLLTINVKAATLRDLRVEKRREWMDRSSNANRRF